MKATEQYFPVVLFTMLYKVVLTFDHESVDEILNKRKFQNITLFLLYGVVQYGISEPFLNSCVLGDY